MELLMKIVKYSAKLYLSYFAVGHYNKHFINQQFIQRRFGSYFL